MDPRAEWQRAERPPTSYRKVQLTVVDVIDTVGEATFGSSTVLTKTDVSLYRLDAGEGAKNICMTPNSESCEKMRCWQARACMSISTRRILYNMYICTNGGWADTGLRPSPAKDRLRLHT